MLEVGRHPNSAEITLGQVLPKPQPFRLTVTTVRPDRGADLVEAEIRAPARRAWASSPVDAILAPSATDLFSPHGPELWDRLRKLRDEGLFDQIGVSVYASDDPVGLAKRFKPDLVQAPASPARPAAADRRHACRELAGMGDRGAPALDLPERPAVPAARPGAEPAEGRRRPDQSRARRLIAEGRSDPLQAALGFALSRPEASCVLVGVASAAEMSAVVAAAISPPPDLDWDEMALDDPDALDPRAWAAA